MPYAFGREVLSFRVSGISIDGNPLVQDKVTEVVDMEHQEIDLLEQREEEWTVIQIDLKAEEPGDAVAELLAGDEGLGSAAKLLVLAKCPETKRRWVQPLEGPDWKVEFVLDRATVSHSLDFKLELVRTCQAVKPMPGRAAHQGDRLASSLSWKVYLDDKDDPIGGAFPCEWKRFEDEEGLKELNHRLWHLDLSDEDKPKIYLNESAPGVGEDFKEVFEEQRARGGSTAKAKARDLVHASILSPLIVELFVLALASAEDVEELTGWRSKIVEELAKKMYPHCDKDAAKKKAWDAWHESKNHAEVLQRLGGDIQDKIGFSGSMKRLLDLTKRARGNKED